MKNPIILWFLGWAITEATNVDPEELMERAMKSIQNDLSERMMHGETSKRFFPRKITPLSKAMSERNNLFQKAVEILRKDGFSLDDAITIGSKSLHEVTRLSRQFGPKVGPVLPSSEQKLSRQPGGQSQYASTIPIIESICKGTPMDCTNESSNPFRRINGTCNNIGNQGNSDRTLWGSTSIKMRRLLPPIFERFTQNLDTRTTTHSFVPDCPTCIEVFSEQCKLPSARLVSNIFHVDDPLAEDNLATHMVTQMGQFLDHDITLTPEEHEDNCCPACFPKCFKFFTDCFSIEIPNNDPFYSTFNKNCLEFTRSTAFCTAEEALNGKFVGSWSTNREQINAITAFVDASNVYSSIDGDSGDENQQDAWDLRMRDGTGKMKVGPNNLLPKATTIGPEMVAIAGDIRAREMPGLASMHTIFVREHNRLCDLLALDSRTNGWGDEAFYQNVRRIVIAEMQNVVYGEYLPMILGSQSMQDNGLNLQTNSAYDETKDPSISNSFATAAFRFGHSMIQGIINMANIANGNFVRNYPLNENFFNLDNYELNNGQGMEEIVMGLITQPAQKNDKFVTSEVTNKLFPEDNQPFGSDLVARNIQRGRDHSLPGYVEFWKAFGKQPGDPNDITCWSHKPSAISQNNWDKLRDLYRDPRQIDLFVGGLAEIPLPINGFNIRSVTGPTFNKMIANQFKALKDGDRYFFTHENQASSFSINGQATIQDRKLADIICDNTNLQQAPNNVFRVVDVTNPFKQCSQAKQLDLNEINLFHVDDPVGL